MARRVTAAQAAEKWANNLAASTDYIRRGVMAVESSPMEAAAERSREYLDGVRRAVESGHWQRRLRSVTLEQWKNATINKGLTILAERARASRGKFAQFMQKWLSYMESIRGQLAQMPRGNLDQNIARMVFMVRAAKRFKEQGLGRAEDLAIPET